MVWVEQAREEGSTATVGSPGGIGGTTSNTIGSRPPAAVTLIVRRGMVVSQSTRTKWLPSAVSWCGDFVPFVAVYGQS